MTTPKWQASKVAYGFRCYARRTRERILVRVEKLGDSNLYTEWEMPKAFGFDAAIDQAAIQTKAEDLRPPDGH